MLLFVGCAKENLEITSPTTRVTNESAKTIEFSKETLKFASMDELDNTILDILLMTPEQQDLWIADHAGFVPMCEAAVIVSDQITKCSSSDEVLALYEMYSDIFIFNPNKKIIKSIPFYKSNKTGYSWVCNAYGDVEIAGQIVNLNDITTFEETWVGKAEQNARLPLSAEARGLNKLAFSTPEGRWSYVDISYTGGKERGVYVIIKYTSYCLIGYDPDVYTVKYANNLTNPSVLQKYEGIYAGITTPGSSGVTYNRGCPTTEYVLGWTSTPYMGVTGYNISSENTGMSGNLIFGGR